MKNNNLKMILEKVKEKFEEKYIALNESEYEITYIKDDEDEEESEGFTKTELEAKELSGILESVFDDVLDFYSISLEIDEGVEKELRIKKMSCDELEREIKALQEEYDKRKCGSKKLTYQQK